MRKFVKFLLVSALVLFVGVPVAFLCFVLGMAALGVTRRALLDAEPAVEIAKHAEPMPGICFIF